MKNKFIDYYSGLYFIIGSLCFLIFGYDIENDKDFMTWLWLFTSITWYLILIKHWIKDNN